MFSLIHLQKSTNSVRQHEKVFWLDLHFGLVKSNYLNGLGRPKSVVSRCWRRPHHHCLDKIWWRSGHHHCHRHSQSRRPHAHLKQNQQERFFIINIIMVSGFNLWLIQLGKVISSRSLSKQFLSSGFVQTSNLVTKVSSSLPAARNVRSIQHSHSGSINYLGERVELFTQCIDISRSSQTEGSMATKTV